MGNVIFTYRTHQWTFMNSMCWFIEAHLKLRNIKAGHLICPTP